MTPPGYVVDASVVLKWLNRENESAVLNALLLLTGAEHNHYRLLSSDLLVHEVFNAMVRGKRIKGQLLMKTLDNFFSFPIDIVATDAKLATLAASVAAQHDLTFYDAMYGAIAKTYKIPLITSDVRDQKNFPGIKVIDIAHWSPVPDSEIELYSDKRIDEFLKEDSK